MFLPMRNDTTGGHAPNPHRDPLSRRRLVQVARRERRLMENF